MWLEGRVYLEYLRLIRDPVFRGVEVPPGLGRPVMLIPGLLAVLTVSAATAGATGYAQVSVVGDIVGGTTVLDVTDPAGDDNGPGTYQYPTSPDFVAGSFDITRFQVITLGSPLSNPFDIHPLTMAGVRAAHLYNVFRYGHPASVEMRFLRDLAAEPRVPTTSIYSRSDGVVNWKACLRSDVNAIEVKGSHVGLALNPEVYRILAHLLPAPWRHS